MAAAASTTDHSALRLFLLTASRLGPALDFEKGFSRLDRVALVVNQQRPLIEQVNRQIVQLATLADRMDRPLFQSMHRSWTLFHTQALELPRPTSREEAQATSLKIRQAAQAFFSFDLKLNVFYLGQGLGPKEIAMSLPSGHLLAGSFPFAVWSTVYTGLTVLASFPTEEDLLLEAMALSLVEEGAPSNPVDLLNRLAKTKKTLITELNFTAAFADLKGVRARLGEISPLVEEMSTQLAQLVSLPEGSLDATLLEAVNDSWNLFQEAVAAFALPSTPAEEAASLRKVKEMAHAFFIFDLKCNILCMEHDVTPIPLMLPSSDHLLSGSVSYTIWSALRKGFTLFARSLPAQGDEGLGLSSAFLQQAALAVAEALERKAQ